MSKKKSDRPPITDTSIVGFMDRVTRVLWSAGVAQHSKFRVSVQSLEEGGYTEEQAWVRAAKNFDALKLLFREYDIQKHDKDVGSHPGILWRGDPLPAPEVECQDIEMSYRECLRWAAAKAGENRRTKEPLTSVPNDTCYYLFQWATEEPKDFMAKLNQVESKEDAEAMLEKGVRKITKRSVDELKEMLKVNGGGKKKGKPKRSKEEELYYEKPNSEAT